MAEYVTEISENDFRAMGLLIPESGCGHTGITVWSVIETVLEDIIKDGLEADLNCLDTIAVAVAGIDEDGKRIKFYDKILEYVSGPRTIRIGLGVRKIYSKRNNFVANDEVLWYARKNECCAVYLIHLNRSWRDRFVVKHKLVEGETDGKKTMTALTLGDDGQFHEDGCWEVNELGGTGKEYIPLNKKAEDA